jgi:hypothetical protein
MAVISRSLTLYGDFELGLVVKVGARDFVVSARKVIDPKKEIKTGLLWFIVQLTGREAFLECATSWSSGKAFSYNVRASPNKWFPAHVNEISQLKVLHAILRHLLKLLGRQDFIELLIPRAGKTWCSAAT